MMEENPVILSLQNPESIAFCEDILIEKIEYPDPSFGTFFFKVSKGKTIHQFPFVFSSLVSASEISTLPYTTNYIGDKDDFFTITLIPSSTEKDPEFWTELSYEAEIKIYWRDI
jgi:hypothetical protein